MIRDFSDKKKNKLHETIKDINEQNGFFDWLGDLFTGDVDISSYVDRIEDYHRDYIDKNNTSVEILKELEGMPMSLNIIMTMIIYVK